VEHEGAPHTDRVELRDGRAVLVAPLHVSDRERFVAGLGRASADSLYRRFMAPVKRLEDLQLRYLLDVDQRDHVALLAVAEDDGLAVGIARFVRNPARPDVAEAAILVVDDWQGVGLGKALGRLLADRARALGIDRFEAWLLSDNHAMLAVLDALGPFREVDRDGPTVRVEVDLPERGIGEHMTGILRAVAAGDFKLAPKPGEAG